MKKTKTFVDFRGVKGDFKEIKDRMTQSQFTHYIKKCSESER